MNQLPNIFNNRELALITWFLILIIYSLTKSLGVLKSMGEIIKIYFSKRILIVNLLCWSYISGIIYVFYLFGFWNSSMIKDTIIWSIISTIILLVNSDRKGKGSLLGVLKSTVQPMVGIEFLVNLESFGFFWEMVLLPFLVFIYVGADLATKDPKHKQVEVFLKWLQAFFGIYILYQSIANIIKGFGTIDGHQYSLNLLLPIWLTISFIPFIYAVMIYSQYEQEKIRQNFNANKRKWTQE